MQIANFVKAVGEGRCSPSIMAALEKAETEQQAVLSQLEEAAHAVRQATLKRPTAERVAEAWGRIGDVWPVLSEDEREGVLGGVVQGVTVTGKEEVTLELLPMPLPLDPSAISHSLGFNLERELGAGKCVKANNDLPSIVIKTAPRRPPGMRRGRKPKPTELGPA